MCQRAKRFLVCFLIGAVSIVAAEPAALAQSSEKPDKIEVSVFGGGSFSEERTDPVKTKLVNGGTFGARLTENFWRYVGLEQAFHIYGTNNLQFANPVAGNPTRRHFGSRMFRFQLNPVFYFTERGRNVRPFLTAGLDITRLWPTNDGKSAAVLTGLGLQGLDSGTSAGLNFGGGLKWHVLDRFGLRWDVRQMFGTMPNLGLARSGPVGTYVIPKDRGLSTTLATAGVTFYFGAPPPPPPPPPAPAPPPPPPPVLRVSNISGMNDVCPGEAVTLTANVSEITPGHRPAYRWTMNGQQVSTDPQYRFVGPTQSGTYRIGVTVSDDPGSSENRNAAPPFSNEVTLRVKDDAAPTITASADRTELQFGESTGVRAQGRGSECGGNLTYRWSASEGNVAGAPAGTFNSNGVQFDMTRRADVQTKNVTLTATVTDAKGRSASAPVNVRVSLPMLTARRFDDVIFPQGSARVNNCGKRVLIDELYPQLTANPDYDIVLIGHIDERERRPGRPRPTDLDRQRVLNVAAVLTAGADICPRLETGRVKVAWVGTDQSAEFRTSFCGTSARPAQRERGGAGVRETDQRARNRRVEIWMVPRGAAMPSSSRPLEDLPVEEVRSKGCPR